MHVETANVSLMEQWFCVGRYVNYFMERVEILVRNGITPYVVFDGGPLPMKKGTEVERRAYVVHVVQGLPSRANATATRKARGLAF
jgi:exonuclease-1